MGQTVGNRISVRGVRGDSNAAHPG